MYVWNTFISGIIYSDVYNKEIDKIIIYNFILSSPGNCNMLFAMTQTARVVKSKKYSTFKTIGLTIKHAQHGDKMRKSVLNHANVCEIALISKTIAQLEIMSRDSI